MSVLQGTAYKIFNLLGITSTGQATKANSLPVTLASDQGALPITDNSGSLTVDGTVTANAGTGPWPVTDNGGTLSVDDGGGSLTVDGTVAVSGTVTVDTELTTADMDIGPGTDTRVVVGLLVAASGGAVVVGGVNPLPVSTPTFLTTNPAANTVGGATLYEVVSAASNNAASVKSSGGKVLGWYVYNAAASVRFVKLYDKATSPSPGSDTPKWVIAVPPGSAANLLDTTGLDFPVGIGLAIVSGISNTDNTAVSANDVIVSLAYK